MDAGFSRQIDAGKVESIVGAYRRAVCDYDRLRIGDQLDRIANEIRFGGLMLTGDTGTHRDVAIEILAGFGTDSFTEYMHGDDRPFPSQVSWKPEDYESGLLGLGIPHQEVFRISALIPGGKLPHTFLNVVIYGQPRIRGLHPDKYPWPPEVSDFIARGLTEAGNVDADGLWGQAKAFLVARGRPKLAEMYEGSGGPSDALTVLLEDYALAKFHDANRLNREGKEVHF